MPSEIVIRSDGFIPASQFSGSGDMKALYEGCVWSYACICANATEAASLGAMVQHREGGRWIRAEHRDLQSLLDEPSGPVPAGHVSPYQRTWQQLIFLLASHLDLDGNAYLDPTLVRDGRRIYSVMPLLPSRVTITEDPETLYPDHYTAGAQVYSTDQLVHIQYPSPFSLSSGHAPIQAALRAIEIDYSAEQRVRWNLENKISPGVIVTVKGFFGATSEQRSKVLSYLSENYQGASRDGTPLVFGEGTEVAAAPSQKSEVDYRAIEAWQRDKILATFLTPPPVVGVYDDATLNNFATAFRMWWMIRLFPVLRMIYSAINSQLIAPIYGQDWRLWYDDTSSEIAILLEQERAEAAGKFVAMGYPPNLATKHVGIDIEHVPVLDAPLQNLALAGRQEPQT